MILSESYANIPPPLKRLACLLSGCGWDAASSPSASTAARTWCTPAPTAEPPWAATAACEQELAARRVLCGPHGSRHAVCSQTGNDGSPAATLSPRRAASSLSTGVPADHSHVVRYRQFKAGISHNCKLRPKL